jgi:hypothetical protein
VCKCWRYCWRRQACSWADHFNCRSCKKCNCILVRNAKKKVSGLMSEFFPDNRWFSKMCNHSSKKSIWTSYLIFWITTNQYKSHINITTFL